MYLFAGWGGGGEGNMRLVVVCEANKFSLSLSLFTSFLIAQRYTIRRGGAVDGDVGGDAPAVGVG